MKVGDRVWVEVERDKERLGTVRFSRRRSTDVFMDDDEVGLFKTYYNDKFRPASSELDTTQIHLQDHMRVEAGPDTATKHDQEKTRLELIPVSGIEGIGRAMTFGSKKYEDHNWTKGFNYSRLIGSAMRHLNAYNEGQDKDPESGLSHLDHLGACVVMLIAHEVEGLGTDDRRKVK